MKYSKADTNISVAIAKTESEDNGLNYFQKVIASNLPSTKAFCTKEDLLKKVKYRLPSITHIVDNTDSLECLKTNIYCGKIKNSR